MGKKEKKGGGGNKRWVPGARGAAHRGQVAGRAGSCLLPRGDPGGSERGCPGSFVQPGRNRGSPLRPGSAAAPLRPAASCAGVGGAARAAGRAGGAGRGAGGQAARCERLKCKPGVRGGGRSRAGEGTEQPKGARRGGPAPLTGS